MSSIESRENVGYRKVDCCANCRHSFDLGIVDFEFICEKVDGDFEVGYVCNLYERHPLEV